MPRLFRDSPLNSIWEGSGNVAALDVLRAMDRAPEALEALMTELGTARGSDGHYDAAVERLEKTLGDPEQIQYRARSVVELMALTLQASVLLRYAPNPVAEAFTASRLGGEWGHVFGTLPRGVDTGLILDRARPRG